ncbi:zinc-dependent alcohol dehydrogenase [Kineococcus sp. SYSU DK003]|uniref:zinc-dependent alcohol dehydrogenase n=1 Tax=Kineococcus sp. SYSU DK003 TaxID=3383124 RepID=UPI003D7C98D2
MTQRSGRAVRITEPGYLELLDDVDVPAPGPGEALVEIAYCGICGSDREVFAGTRPAEFVRYPVVPGHEWSGTVREVGPGVPEGIVGRGVVGQGIRTAEGTPSSVEGDTEGWAQAYEETGFTLPGGWSTWLTIPARYLHLLPEGADLRAAAGIEPAACVAEAVLLADVSAGSKVAVVGAGTLGLLCVQLLAGAGCQVTVVHHNEDRRELAATCGAAHYTPDAGTLADGTFDAVIEAAGVPGVARTSVRLTRRGGRVVLTGIPAQDADDLSSLDLVSRNVHVLTVFGAPTRAWAYAVRAFSAGVLDPAPLITHEFDLAEAQQALDVLAARSGALKVLLKP